MVRNVIKKVGYNGRAAHKKPFISCRNRKKRLEFAKKHVTKPLSFWESVLFSDKSKFNIHGSDGRVMVWRKPNQHMLSKNLCGNVKHGGGGVMMWGCMSTADVGNLCFIEGNMDRFMYLDILKQNILPSAERLSLGTAFTFQQDDPKHTAMI